MLTIFGLLLLTAIAMSMMFSSDAETQISVNYRDSQSSTYSAISAVQEARDRIQPLSGDLALSGYVPTKTPDGGGQVLYIINPNTLYHETVASIAPWSATVNGKTNPYFDQELCQEGMLGLTRGTSGVACSGGGAVPTGGCSPVSGGGGGWCYYYDNSANATQWQLKDSNGNAIPLDYKWVRISLKEDWNTPTYVGATASGKQVCWDGNYQSQIPGGYSTNCQAAPGDQVVGVNVTSAGSGFTSAPTVTITGGGGSGATAVANLGTSATGSMSSASVTSGGSSYTSPPTVTVSSPDGSGATFQAIITGAPVTAVSVNNSSANYCYASTVTPTVNLTTSPTTNTLTPATPTVNMGSTGCIAAISLPSGSCPGAASTSFPIGSTAPPGGGSGFSGSVTYNAAGTVSSITVSNVGSSYSNGANNITISGGHGKNAFSCTISPTFTTGKTISSISIPAGQGGEYMTSPTASLGGSGPSQPSSTTMPTMGVTWSATASTIKAVNVTAGGSGYLHPPYTLVFTGGGGSGAVASATTGTTNIISSFTVTNGGLGYTTAPTVTISGGGPGTGASATATIAAGGITTSMGQVYLLTSLAVTRSGSKSMAQMEAAARPPFDFNLGGALTLAGPEPANDFNAANSSNFGISGTDANSCGQTAAATKPAIGVYDSTSQADVIAGLPNNRYANYTGAGSDPSVENVYTAIGGASATPSALDGFVGDMASKATYSVQGNASSLPATTTGSVTYINGNLTLSGNPSGSGILIVTGTLTFSGNFTWNGLVLVIGQGIVVHNGGGNGSIDGAIYIAQTQGPSGELPSLGNPQFTWNGGGTNSVTYDHCLADNLLNKYVGQPSSLPLQVLSTRTLEF